MAVSDRLGDDEQRAFMESPDVRDARRQARLGELAIEVGQNFRGKRRPALFEGTDIPRPDPISEVSLRQLGALLKTSSRHNLPLKDEITAYPKVGADWDSIERYITYAGSKQAYEKRRREEAQGTLPISVEHTLTKEERGDKTNAKRRQSQHVADKIQRDFRTGLTTAVIRRAALSSVQDSIRQDLPISLPAAHFAADAIEDFGNCLAKETELLGKMPGGEDMPRLLRHLGEYSADNPGILLEHDDVLQLVGDEQGRRAEFWGGRLESMLEYDKDRRTSEELLAEEHVEQLIASFEVH